MDIWLQGPNKLVPEGAKPYDKRGHYELCELCYAQCIAKFGWEANVVHADLIPSTVGLRIFQAMPKRVRAKALLMSLVPGKGAALLLCPGACQSKPMMNALSLLRIMCEHTA